MEPEKPRWPKPKALTDAERAEMLASLERFSAAARVGSALESMNAPDSAMPKDFGDMMLSDYGPEVPIDLIHPNNDEDGPAEYTDEDMRQLADAPASAVPFPLSRNGKVNVTLYLGPNFQPTRLDLSGRTFDDLGGMAEGLQKVAMARFQRVKLWARHMVWRAVAGFAGFTFVAAMGVGPWLTVAYMLALLAAGEVAMKLDATPGLSCHCGRRFLTWRGVARHHRAEDDTHPHTGGLVHGNEKYP